MTAYRPPRVMLRCTEACPYQTTSALLEGDKASMLIVPNKCKPSCAEPTLTLSCLPHTPYISVPGALYTMDMFGATPSRPRRTTACRSHPPGGAGNAVSAAGVRSFEVAWLPGFLTCTNVPCSWSRRPWQAVGRQRGRGRGGSRQADAAVDCPLASSSACWNLQLMRWHVAG